MTQKLEFVGRRHAFSIKLFKQLSPRTNQNPPSLGSIMLGDTKIHEITKAHLKEPALVQGLPGLGYVGKVAVDYFVEKLKPKKFAELYSGYLLFPDGNLGINISEDGTYSLPKYEFYAYEEREP